jgi:xanthine dehydrogenase accessory factor
VCWVDETPVETTIAGVIRGLLHEGLPVYPGMKIGDVDPRAAREHCYTISDKSLAVGGGVLEAVLYLLRQWRLASVPARIEPLQNVGMLHAMRKAAD